VSAHVRGGSQRCDPASLPGTWPARRSGGSRPGPVRASWAPLQYGSTGVAVRYQRPERPVTFLADRGIRRHRGEPGHVGATVTAGIRERSRDRGAGGRPAWGPDRRPAAAVRSSARRRPSARCRRGRGRALVAGLPGADVELAAARPPARRGTVSSTDTGWLLEVSDAAADRPPSPALGRVPGQGGLGLRMVADLCDAHDCQGHRRRHRDRHCPPPAAAAWTTCTAAPTTTAEHSPPKPCTGRAAG
jgi:hypothetical protein